MFRWLKDRKRTRKGKDQKRSEDDYGFQTEEKVITSDYGFNENRRYVPNNRITDSPYHIYEEILDLPDLPLTSEFARLNLQVRKDQMNDRVRTNRHMFTKTENEGPYMVVPIASPNTIPCEGSHNCTCAASDKIYSDSTFCSEDSSNKPLCACMQRSNSEGLFRCTCRQRPRSSEYTDPWDRSDTSGNSLINTLSDSDLVRLSMERINLRRQNQSTNDVTESNGISHHSSKESINRSEAETEDTGCEYDMSTSSGGSEVTEYRSCLEKIERNLVLKEQVRNIIKTLTNESDHTESDEQSNACDSTDKASTPTVSGRSSSARTLSCGEVSESDLFADRSESDDSSGYYECTDEKAENIKCYAHHKSNRKDEIQSCVKEGVSDDPDLQELVLLPTRVSKNKHRPVRHKPRKSGSVKSDKVRGKIEEDTEMYLLPTNRRHSECSDVRVYRKPVLPFQNTPIYHDPYRAKSGGSGNRLLTDLIQMNYDKQHMVI